MFVIKDWQIYSIILSVIGVAVSLMFYLLYKIFGEVSLLQTAKEEMSYAITTVLLVAIVLSMFGASGTLTQYLRESAQALYLDIQDASGAQTTNVNAETPVDLVMNEINTTKNTYLLSGMLDYVYYVGLVVYPLGTYTEDAFMSEVVSGAGWRPVTDVISNIFRMSAFYAWVYYIFLQILYFIKYFWGVLFTLGIALRGFRPTRGAGAYLIALSVGMFFVFPITYLLGTHTAVVFMHRVDPTNQNFHIPSMFAPTGTCGPEVNPTGINIPPPSTSIGWAKTVKNIGNSKSFKDKLSDLYDMITHWSSFLYSMLCMMPMVSLVLTLTFILSTTELFGGNIPEVSRGLIRLV